MDVLYKYGRLNEHSSQLFSSNTLYFASPTELNDPFECYPVITGENLSEEKYREYLIRQVKQRGGTRAAAKTHASKMLKAGVHRDPKVWVTIRKELKAAYDTLGFYCLSAVRDEILMWSHYADEHRGYCIEFEATDATRVFGLAQEVTYSLEYPVLDFLDDDDWKRAKLALLTKYKGWKYEKEWRIIYESKGLKYYPIKLMKSVTLGARMADDDKNKIRGWLDKRNSPVSLMQAELHDSRYAIKIVEQW